MCRPNKHVGDHIISRLTHGRVRWRAWGYIDGRLPLVLSFCEKLVTRHFGTFATQSNGGLNRSTQHFILKRKDGVYGDESKVSSRLNRVNLTFLGPTQPDWRSGSPRGASVSPEGPTNGPLSSGRETKFDGIPTSVDAEEVETPEVYLYAQNRQKSVHHQGRATRFFDRTA